MKSQNRQRERAAALDYQSHALTLAVLTLNLFDESTYQQGNKFLI